MLHHPAVRAFSAGPAVFQAPPLNRRAADLLRCVPFAPQSAHSLLDQQLSLLQSALSEREAALAELAGRIEPLEVDVALLMADRCERVCISTGVWVNKGAGVQWCGRYTHRVAGGGRGAAHCRQVRVCAC